MGRPKGDSIDQKSGLYIALEDVNFFWTVDQVKRVEDMWKQGVPLDVMASDIKRDPDEVALLIMDRVRNGRLERRQGGVFGSG